ncbi:MAG: hypothetical protein ACRC7R_06740, partial [Sarcina sp.]
RISGYFMGVDLHKIINVVYLNNEFANNTMKLGGYMEDKDNELNNLSNDENLEEKLVDENINEVIENEIENNVEDMNNEEVVETIEVKDVVEKVDDKKPNFLKRLMQSIIDESIILVVALGLLFLSDLILRVFGLFIAERVPFYFIVFVLANVIYAPILKSTKLRCTIGEKILKIK